MKKEEIAAVWESIDNLVPWDQNPRYNLQSIQIVANSIKRFGFGAPIVARREDKMVIAGHTRLEAAKKIGLEKVPVRYLDLDPADAKMLALADNKVGEIAKWDDNKLQSILKELRDQEHDIADLGWSNHELDVLLEEAYVGKNDPYEEYIDMPEYINNDETSYKKIVVNFANKEDYEDFKKRIGQDFLTKKSVSTWYPPSAQLENNDDRY